MLWVVEIKIKKTAFESQVDLVENIAHALHLKLLVKYYDAEKCENFCPSKGVPGFVLRCRLISPI